MKKQKSAAFAKRSQKLKEHCHYTGIYQGAVHSMYNLKYSIPKEIFLLFHNGSFEREFNFLGENTEKCAAFSVLTTKEVEKY